ncbi:MAG: hypothetical protein U5Q44_05005 [Dehalococcoidia bacterium]|nr:hypothetical protein [Dehalococcoidia bacterium]
MRQRIAVIGLPFFGRRVARSLRQEGFRARYVPHPGRDPLAWLRAAPVLAQADLVYTIGSSARTWGPADVLAKLRKRIVMHWAGTDVLHALRDWQAGRASKGLLRRAHHWAAAPWLVEELEPMGVRAEPRALPMVIKTGTDLPLPETFRVLVFLATEPHSAYDISGTMQVIESLPDIPFVMVGGYRPAEIPDNLEVVGWVEDMQPQYARTSAYLRLVHHDAMSHSVIEALGYGRQVLWSYEIPGVTRVEGPEHAVEVLRELAANADTQELNATGKETAAQFHPSVIIPAAAEAMRELLE